jgi:hypothetical protein
MAVEVAAVGGRLDDLGTLTVGGCYHRHPARRSCRLQEYPMGRVVPALVQTLKAHGYLASVP